MFQIRRFITFCFLAASILVSGLASADSAQSFLEGKQRELTSLIKKSASPANEAKLKSTFDALLDYDTLAKESLGDEWDTLTEDQRKEFQSLLTTLVQSSYTKNIRGTLDYNITFKGTSPAKKGELVQTVAKHKTDARKEAIHIDYLVHKVSGKYRVFDIITEGSSLVRNYKSQFRRVIKKKGFPELLNRMRKKAKES